ncbi:MAG TPA: FkbM family methyltransferase [Saprospiraceae bacterium]|nr:FkbM family methyltransferase [Saprospiraceae bacterium]
MNYLIKLIQKKVNQFIQLFELPLIKKHPFRFACRLLKLKFFHLILRKPFIANLTNKLQFLITKNSISSRNNYLCGLREFEFQIFLLHYLKKKDGFMDIGANVGIYSTLASSHTECHSYAIEPHPKSMVQLKKNIELNQLQNLISTYEFALGAKEAEIKLNNSLDTQNSIITNQSDWVDGINIHQSTLDSQFFNHSIQALKMDVEGYEKEIIKGASSFLANTSLNCIIIELSKLSLKYNSNSDDIHNALLSFGFKPYLYFPFDRQFQEILDIPEEENAIYIRDIEQAKSRVQNADKIKVYGEWI